ncbi:hypothetical protein Nepgr_010117 [Nepenthes gracilis]|uniref:Uncharacterized protein n=1 Tax=Nepenthes gracilis TaxID=150966 RepID=A0AAD3XKR9_NEPGR|nr:hypothetical protein Nepgr_010117 [Nepenthes gracilis]
MCPDEKLSGLNAVRGNQTFYNVTPVGISLHFPVTIMMLAALTVLVLSSAIGSLRRLCPSIPGIRGIFETSKRNQK